MKRTFKGFVIIIVFCILLCFDAVAQPESSSELISPSIETDVKDIVSAQLSSIDANWVIAITGKVGRKTLRTSN